MEQTQKTILVVDDEPDVVSYLTTLLLDNGYLVNTAASGKEGFAKAKADHPDLIALDISMPEETGVRMYRNLQEDSTTADIPVIVITGLSHEFKRFIESRKHIRPPEGYFDKPIDREQFLEKLQSILGNDQTRPQAD